MVLHLFRRTNLYYNDYSCHTNSRENLSSCDHCGNHGFVIKRDARPRADAIYNRGSRQTRRAREKVDKIPVVQASSAVIGNIPVIAASAAIPANIPVVASRWHGKKTDAEILAALQFSLPPKDERELTKV